MSAEEASTKARTGRVRYGILALLFFATTINYVDRSVLGVLSPHLMEELHWTGTDYGRISAAFTLAYALGFLVAGFLIDRLGTRIGYAGYLLVWSVAAALHGLCKSPLSFALARFGLGLGESGNFPAAVKTVAEWFPKQERALAVGVFNAGSNVGAILAPLVVPWLALTYGWQWAFVVTGVAGLIWLLFWWPLYRPPSAHPRVSPAELAWIRSDAPNEAASAEAASREDGTSPDAKGISWFGLLGFRQTWAFALGKLLTDSIWWYYLFWFPLFMKADFGVDLKTIGPPLMAVYALADVGSVAGGFLSSAMIGRGVSPNVARKLAMLACAVCVLPVAYAPHTPSKWVAVGLVGVAAAAHQGFSANLYTITSDLFPGRIVGSVVGIGSFFGAMGGFALNLGAGALSDHTGDYSGPFAVAGLVYLAAVLVIHALSPRLEPARL